ncbi:UvrD-helicase domain-containing protein [Costertonia aggregata]|uniref:DNA 3'-5' helicase n=1 Tax=Costertonia aggregata TaxID=343403 RepID=A0A7H9APW5_9FLAO|nr:UvrD-helicase domain-containing protein [Costertonia aggregata]QLG45476.1 UvrD-helicase domain-containing protein [Costertonia aggregata]
MQKAPYKIYNASAGSGKTYTLTKTYLKIVLSARSRTSFRHILAITFTNKAVNEMKNRILESLFQFGKVEQVENAPIMFKDILVELAIDAETLKKRSRSALKYILHNYAFFDVSTIDKFTHRLIRTFAKDLKLPQNFEVVLDTDLLLDEAISKLLYRVGKDKKLTQVLLDFALEKIDDDKSWDITFDLTKIGKLLFDENHVLHLKSIANKSIDDFLVLKKELQKKIQSAEKAIIANAKETQYIFNENGLEQTDFKSGWFPKFISKISQGDLAIDFAAGWKKNFATDPLYSKACPEPTKVILDNLHPTFNELFQNIRSLTNKRNLLKNTYQNIVPLTVLNAIQHEIKTLELEQDLLPISSFNKLIANEIKHQPAPFIYERLGEKYRHYFIDEFQDTSEMQWNNLIPLIGNALESLDEQGQKGSLVLVGDAKQAIYRWRGGKAEQFLGLCENLTNPFTVEPNIETLSSNYRSHQEIIHFNNDFFSKNSSFLNNGIYSSLFFNGNKQKPNTKKGGCVTLYFIDPDDEKSEDELYCEQVLETIKEVTFNKHALRDVCVLTRKKKHGVVLADFLMQHQIPIISSETLLLKSNAKVKFLVDMLRYCTDPSDLETSYRILSFLAPEGSEKHTFITKHLQSLNEFLTNEHDFSIDFLKQVSVYDGFESIIKCFDLIQDSDAYLTYMLDTVLEVEQKEGGNQQAFLQYWEKKKDTLSITVPENIDAVQIMTVHKSKGLEFPIVLFPYADTYIYEEIDPKIWVPVNPDDFNGFGEVLLSKKKEVVDYNEASSDLFQNEQHKLELDAFNLLYVALTRAVKGLYVISKKNITAKGEYKPNYYSGLFIHYLKELGQWDATKSKYTFGELEPNHQKGSTVQNTQKIPFQYTHKNRPSFRILTKSGILWDTEREEAIGQGNLLHHIMEMIETEEDIQSVFTSITQKGKLASDEKEALHSKVRKIIAHPKLNQFYTIGNIVKNEKDIITKNGLILRPDRIVIKNGTATLIDYKTGKRSSKYHEQLYTYADALLDMGYPVENKIIVYVNDEIVPEFI